MTPAQAAWLQEVRFDAQKRAGDFPVVALHMLAMGWLRADLHGCLAVTPAGLAALEAYERGDG